MASELVARRPAVADHDERTVGLRGEQGRVGDRQQRRRVEDDDVVARRSSRSSISIACDCSSSDGLGGICPHTITSSACRRTAA